MREIKKPQIKIFTDTDNCKINDNKQITLLLSTSLIQTMKNVIISNKSGNDFRYSNVSHLIRSALEAYKNGMNLWANPIHDKKQKINLQISKELYNFYSGLPRGLRHEICERAINSYIKQGLI
jgi:hypothetical protein